MSEAPKLPDLPAPAELIALPAAPDPVTLAMRDIVEGSSRSWIWMRLALQDIRMRYRGSVLGPFWLTITTGLTILVMVAVYARLFNRDLHIFLPFLIVGLIVWQLVASLINESCSTFTSQAAVIQQIRMPLSIHAWRVVARNALVFAHHAVLIPIGLFAFATPVGWHTLLVVVGFVVLLFNGFCTALWLGMFCARFRDIPPIVQSVLQLAFLVTPIFWMPHFLGEEHRLIATLNPLYAYIDIMRAPLVGMETAPYTWTIVGTMTAANALLAYVIFTRFRRRIPYWVS